MHVEFCRPDDEAFRILGPKLVVCNYMTPLVSCLLITELVNG
jgi:hypothetical protein